MGTLRYACAGHPCPIHVPDGGRPVALGCAGLPVGLFADAEYDEAEVEFGPGDRLYLYSDGVTDTVNETNEEFGITGLGGIAEGDSRIDTERNRAGSPPRSRSVAWPKGTGRRPDSARPGTGPDMTPSADVEKARIRCPSLDDRPTTADRADRRRVSGVRNRFHRRGSRASGVSGSDDRLPTGCDAESGQSLRLCQNAPMLRPAGRRPQRVLRCVRPEGPQNRGMLAVSRLSPYTGLRFGSRCTRPRGLRERVPTEARPVFSRVQAVRNGSGAGNLTKPALNSSAKYGGPHEHAGAKDPGGGAMSGLTAPCWKRASWATRHPAVPIRAAVRPRCAARSIAPGSSTSTDHFLARLRSCVRRLL